jgi:uncharacterized repeat protein (TIGR01451 family)
MGVIVPAQAASGSSNGVDLAVAIAGPDEAPPRGATFPVVINVTNQGATAASDVSLTSYLGDALRLDKSVGSNGMTCELGEFGEMTCSLPSLASGQTATVALTLTRMMARETWIDVWASSAADEADWEDNYTGIALAPDRTNPADLQVTISAPVQPNLDEEFDYTAIVTNRGPETARDVKFYQSLADGVEFVGVASSDPTDDCSLHTDTYDTEGFEGGPYTYREVRCDLGNMQFAGQAEITVTVVRKDAHELWSSAWVQSSSFDENYENDWADASTASHPSVTSDLAMTLEGPSGTPLVGDDFVYTVTVTNLGPAPANDVAFETWLPEQLALRSLTPSRAGDTCEQGIYQGIQCKFGSLAVGDTASVEIAVTRVGARELWMGASIYSSNSDPNWDNNYSELETGPDKSVPADVAVTVDAPKDPAVGSDYSYTATVTNNGPSPATSVRLTSGVPEGTTYVSATSPDDTDVCTLYEETYEDQGMKSSDGAFAPYTYREVRCDLGTLVPAEAATITVTVHRDSEYELWNGAWVSTASYDDNYDNDYASVGSSGKPFPGCGMPTADDGGMVACDLAGGESYGAKRAYVAGSQPGRRTLRGGGGNDTITLNVPTSSKDHRRIVVNAGRGSDEINLVLAPGAGNVTVVLKGGSGSDSINVAAPRPGKHFKLRMWGGAGTDSCSAAVGDRHRSRTC